MLRCSAIGESVVTTALCESLSLSKSAKKSCDIQAVLSPIWANALVLQVAILLRHVECPRHVVG